MSLLELSIGSLTDKNTTHSYLDLYERLLNSKKDTAKRVLEIGIGDFIEKNGGSIKLWRDYFTNAKVYALDKLHINRVIDELKEDSRVVLYTSIDAYDENFVKKTFVDENIKFDMLLDDGPHTLESMVNFIKLYSELIADDGILIIEDIQDWSWTETLVSVVPEELKQYVELYDLRHIKNRYDDIVLVINKNK
jgi:hypothetical protein